MNGRTHIHLSLHFSLCFPALRAVGKRPHLVGGRRRVKPLKMLISNRTDQSAGEREESRRGGQKRPFLSITDRE